MSELKPCPFCGGSEIVVCGVFNVMYCNGCGAETDMGDWNTRPIEDALNKRIAELSQALGLITTLKPTMVMDTDHPLDMAKEVAEYVSTIITNTQQANRGLIANYVYELDENAKLTARIAELEGELAELKERFDITDGLLNQATVSIGAVIACCTYNSNAEAMAGAYGISYRAFTMIDNFIKNYNRAVLDGKISTDGTLSSQSGAIGR